MANNKSTKLTSFFDWEYFLRECIKKWPWFVASVLICCVIGAVKYKLTAPLAQINAKVLVSDDSSKGSGGLASLMSKQFDLGNMLGGTGSVYNEMQVMGSHTVFENTVKELGLNCNYSVKLKWTKPWVQSGEKMPVRLEYDKTIADTLGVALAFSVTVDNNAMVSYKVKKGWRTLAEGSRKSMPCLIATPYGEFTLVATGYLPKGKSFKEKILLQSYNAAAEGYEKAVRINTMSKKVDVVGYSMITSDPEFGKKILTALISNYNKAGILHKQEKGEMTAEFLNRRLHQISSDLESMEAGMQDYKMEHGLTLVEQDAKLAYTQAKTLRNQLVTAEAEFEIMKLVRGFIEDPVNNHSLVPAIGEDFGSAATAITAYNEVIMERMRLMNNARENNAAIKLIDEQLDAMRGNIKLSLTRGMETYQARLAELKKEVSKAESRLGAVPATEREFVGLERNRAVQEKLYLYLLQQQEENAMRMDASLPRGVIIDEPYISGEPIGLSLSKMLALSFVLGLCLPGGFLFVKERMRKKVISGKEIKNVVKAPVLAEVDGHDDKKSAESLCAGVRCMLGADGNKIAMVTSADAAGMKDYIAYNLAKSTAASGIKTLLLELDFRNPELASILKLPSPKGVVQCIVDNQDAMSVMTHVATDLDVMVAGGIAPNPVALVSSSTLMKLITKLSEQYDCIIIDVPSVCDSSDALFISPVAGASVVVCGIGTTDVDYLPKLSQLISDGSLKNAGLVIASDNK